MTSNRKLMNKYEIFDVMCDTVMIIDIKIAVK